VLKVGGREGGREGGVARIWVGRRGEYKVLVKIGRAGV